MGKQSGILPEKETILTFKNNESLLRYIFLIN